MKRACLLFVAMTLALPCGLVAADQPATAPAAPLTAVIGAFDAEQKLLESRLADRQEQFVLGIRFVRGTLCGRPVVLGETGIGKVNAAMTTSLLISQFRPTEVIFSGIAGGLNPDLGPADIVIATATFQHDFGKALAKHPFVHVQPGRVGGDKHAPPTLTADPRLLAIAQDCGKTIQLEMVQAAAGPRQPRVLCGIVATGDVFVGDPDKSQEIRKAFNADAVEMEGAAVAQVCNQFQTPCLIIRSISDMADAKANRDLKQFRTAAARNSALLVCDIVARLNSVPTTAPSLQATPSPSTQPTACAHSAAQGLDR